MKILIALFTYVIVFNTTRLPAFQLTFEEVLTIGEKDSDNSAFLFSGITNLKVLDNNNIIVSDVSDNSIRVFNETGEFLRRIGRRGRGPGEFQHITSIFLDSENRIQVLDRFQNRISIFEKNGTFQKSIKLNSVPVGTSIFVSQIDHSKNYLIGYRDYRNISNTYLLHKFDSTFSTQLNKYIDVFKHFYNVDDKMEVQISQRPAYLFTSFLENYLAMVPDVYTGTIVVFDKNSSKVKLIGEKISEYVKQYNWNNREQIRSTGETGFASSSSQSGRFFYKQKGGTFGLLANDRFLLHFYAINSGQEIQPFLKVYNRNLELIETLNLQNESELFIDQNRISGIPHFLDKNNRLYISDHLYNDTYPAIRVFEINLDELDKN